MPENEKIDQSSFASILAGVQKMREAYEPVVGLNLEAPNAEAPKPASGPEPLNETSISKSTSAEKSSATQKTDTHTQREIRGDVSIHSGDFSTRSASSRPKQTDPRPTESRPTESRQREARPRNDARRHPGPSIQTYTSVQVANSQKGNPLLESPLMKATPWSYNSSILSDYYINATLQILFLLLKYHKLRPEYVWRRIEKLKGLSETSDDDQALRVLLVVVDIDSPQEAIRHLLGICFKQNLTMIVAWSFEEAGNYISYFKQNELASGKVDSSIQGVRKNDYNLNIVSTLTNVRAVNKTDVANLLANCKLFRQVVLASTSDDLAEIPGLGDRKLQNLRAAFSEPFVFNKEY